MDRFYTTFKQYCQENNVISEFIRFHPMLNNHYYCPKDIEIEFWNETVAIDLTKDETEIFRDMEYNCQKAIRQAHNNNVIIQKDEDFRYLDDFYDIYIKTMTRVNANDYYLFPRKWFDAVIELLAGNLSLFHAFYQDSIIASVLFLHSGPFLHAHLGGSIHEMRHLRPNNLLLYQVALWGKKCGFKIFHLGGGLKHNDNLFKYKASFSPIRMNFYIGKVIHNYELYKSLTDLKSDFEGDNPLDAHYFPEYRPPKAISSRRPFYKGISSIRPFYKVLAYEDPQDRQEWHTLCESFKEIDIYFYPEFSYLCQLHGDGQAFCFVYFESPGNVVIYPFLARRINELTTFNNCPDNLIDITSPYGYGGYLRSSDQVDMDRFYTTFKQYCQDNNVISEFVRFHPLLNNHYYCPKDIKIEVWNETVAIDLTKDESEIFLDMYYNCRYNVRKAIKSGVIIQIDEDFRHLDDFYDIYIKTMTRVNAHDYYFFTRKWFYDAARLLSGNLSLFHAVYQDSIIASGLFMHSGPFVHAHLGGSIYEMRHLRANNLLLYQVALWAKKCGFKIYHLGGGVNPKDDLFKFKASFSPIRMNYYIGKAIHDHEFYKSLTDLRSDSEDGNPLGGLYFPEYRPPILN
jgi:lipid II:glycine glycyltransferase (peptidoglycan interpeptide bridge formation enzyme)